MIRLSWAVAALMAAWAAVVVSRASVAGAQSGVRAAAEATAREYLSSARERMGGDVGSAEPGGATLVGTPPTLVVRLRASESGGTECVQYSVGPAGIRFRRLAVVSGPACSMSFPLTGWADAATGGQAVPGVSLPSASLCALEISGGAVLVWVQDEPCAWSPRASLWPPVTVRVNGVDVRSVFQAVGVRTWP